MEQLPQEIVDLIATFIPRYPDHFDFPFLKSPGWSSELPRYATISSTWKHPIESMVFQEINLKNKDIQAFDALFRGDRRQFLTNLILDVVLPNYDDESCGRFENKTDKNANNEVLSKAIENLFAILKS